MSPARRASARFCRRLPAFLGDRGGSTAVEYTIIAALVSIAIVASFGQITDPLGQLFTDVGDSIRVN